MTMALGKYFSMDPDKEPVVYDDEECAERGGGLNHIQEIDGRCPACNKVCYRRRVLASEVKLSPRPRNAAQRRYTKIPPQMRDEYHDAVLLGLDSFDAQALIALRHGLAPAQRLVEGDPQPLSWTLAELVRIEFIAYLHGSGRIKADKLPNTDIT